MPNQSRLSLFTVLLLLMTALGLFCFHPAKAQQKPDSDAAQIEMALIPVLSGYPAGETLSIPVVMGLPQGMSLAPPSSGQSLRYAIKNEDAFKVTELNLAPRPQEAGAYTGIVLMEFKVTVSASLQPGIHRLEGSLLAPIMEIQKPLKVDFSFPMNVLAAGETPKVMHPQMLRAILERLKIGMNAKMAPNPAPAQAPQEEDPFAGESFWWVLLGVFLGGLGLNLTPCVFPMIPITVSYFGGRSGGAKAMLAMHSLVYLAGLVLTYTVLGAFVSLSGRMLGEALTNPWVTGAVTIIILIMASSMFGLWEIRLPSSLNRLAATDRAGMLGSLVMGLTVGILAAPCVGPFVVGLMTHVARVGELGYGLLLFALLSLGLGLPLSILAVFSGFLARLPRAGDWMIWVRKFFGVVLVLMAGYVAQTLLGPKPYFWIMSAVTVIGAVYLGLIDKSGQGGFKLVKRLGALALLIAVGAYFWMATPTLRHMVLSEGPASGEITWQKFSPDLLEKAAGDGKAVVIDFAADWCAPCRQMEADTFPDKRVIEGMAGFVTLKADVTKGPSPELKPYAAKWRIRGVPTLIFIDKTGKFLPEFTLVGYRGPEALAAHLAEFRKRIN